MRIYVAPVRIRTMAVVVISVAAALGGLPTAVAAEEPSVASIAPVPTTDKNVVQRNAADSAMADAQATGQRVEDVSQRTETTKVYANPDGSWTSDTASEPERVQDRDGSWHAIDTTLVPVAGGGFAPKHAVGDLRLSDGGDREFASLQSSGRDLTWEWPRALPQPIISGSSATYPDAVDGGDLVVTALSTGFRHDIVLRDRPDSPLSIAIPIVTGDGPNITGAESGAVSIETKSGQTLATASAPVMYSLPDALGESTEPAGADETNAPATMQPSSAASPASESPSPAPSLSTESEVPQSEVPAEVQPVDPADLQAPDATETVASSLTQTADGAVLTLRPDAEFLANADTHYPVVIDPTVTVSSSGDSYIGSGAPDATHPNDDTLKAGSPNGTDKMRAIVVFPTQAAWRGQKIVSSTLLMRNFYATSCTGSAGNMNAYRITSPITWSTLTWNNRPTFTGVNASWTDDAYGASGCAANDMQVNLAGMTQDWANGSANYGVQLSANTETCKCAYREFRSASYTTSTGYTGYRPRLVVNYSLPQASELSVSNTSGSYVAIPDPTISARLSHPNGKLLTGHFTASDSTTGAVVWSQDVQQSTVNSVVTANVPTDALEPRSSYQFKVVADDGSVTSPAVSSQVLQVVPITATAPAVACADPCTPVTPTTVFSDSIPAGASRAVTVDVPDVDADSVGQISATFEITSPDAGGTLTVGDPTYPAPGRPTLTYSGGTAQVTADVYLSTANQIALTNNGSSAVAVTLRVTGWRPWATQEDVQDAQAEEPASVDPADAEQVTGVTTQEDLDAVPQPAEAAVEPDEQPPCQPSADGSDTCVEPGVPTDTPEDEFDPATIDVAPQTSETTTAQGAINPISCPAVVGSWEFTGRFNACTIERQRGDVFKYQNGQKRKIGSYQYLRYVSTDLDSRTLTLDVRWRYHMEWMSNNIGAVSVNNWLFCDNPTLCTSDRYIEHARLQIATGEIDSPTYLRSATAAIPSLTAPNTIETQLAETNNTTASANYDSNPVRLPRARCDNLRYLPGVGCVYKQYTPTFKLSRAVAPASAGHIVLAQANPRWAGRLSRHYWDGEPNLNRRVARATCRARHYTLSCDEYPFASTNQGCYQRPPCSVAGIPRTDNSKSGSLLGSFYGTARVADNDAFYVRIVP